MANVFISYRRDDTGDFTARIVDRLRARPEIGQVFLDVEGIEPGANFANKIDDALKQCEFCLLIIGPNWTGKKDGGAARIADPGDWVRLEAKSALTSDAKVVPVLATGASMPHAEDLPEDLRQLARIQAVSVRRESFERDVDFLVDIILKRKKPTAVQDYLNRHPLQAGALKSVRNLVLTLLVMILVLAIQFSFTGRSLDQLLGGNTGLAYVVVIVILAAGTALPFFMGRRRKRPA
jgi:hypothetical protein